MSVVAEKLYPPIIGSSIPAFYNDGGTAEIAVPFSMNRAVSANNISGFRLKIKTVQSNMVIKTLDVTGSTAVNKAIVDKVIRFYWENASEDTDFAKIKLGQFLKIQIAYLDTSATPQAGYFSTIGIIKYTSKPYVYIEGLENNQNSIAAFRTNYTGVYKTTSDKSERPYAYCFILYDSEYNIVESTGWLLHNTSVSAMTAESLSLTTATDSYHFTSALVLNDTYYVQYGVRTINNIEIYSPMYTCIEPEIANSSAKLNLVAENVFEEGYIEVTLQLMNGYTIDDVLEDGAVSIEIQRAELTDNYRTWQALKRYYFTNYATALNYVFKDFTIEQGITYKYCFRQYNSSGLQSNREESNEVLADFEDMFLWDGEKQLKIRFNPKVSSFKETHLESKLNTIGSKYPFIFRNGIINYKEFPISGLISYKADNNEWFLKAEEDYNIILGGAYRRSETPDDNANKPWETVETLDSVGYNMRAERKFKLKLLEWLNNGEIKLFKSPAEGNYLIRIINVSLTPEDRLGRMLHSFTANAYEVEEITYTNLLNLGFFDISEPSNTTLSIDSFMIKNKSGVSSLTASSTNSIKLNSYDIVKQLVISLSPNTEYSAGLYLRIGGNDVNHRVWISGTGLVLTSEKGSLPDIYLNGSDNSILLEEGSSLLDLIGDSTIRYFYEETDILVGEFDKVISVNIENKVCTYYGPRIIENNYSLTSENNIRIKTELLRYLVLNFQSKNIKDIYKVGNNYYDNSSRTIQIHFADYDTCYIVHNLNASTFQEISQQKYYLPESRGRNIGNLVSVNNFDTSISIMDKDGNSTIFATPPEIDLNNDYYERITLGNGVYLNCAYQVKTTKYRE